jgi:squalene-hopene/tetraprenyl-beta-curcumene cyclase
MTRSKTRQRRPVAVMVLLLSLTTSCSHSAPPLATRAAWNPYAAAAYLDSRADWWINWPVSARDHGTFCISCHTALPYALSRPALRHALGQPPSPNEQKLLDNVSRRVRLWNQVEPYYDSSGYDHKSNESRGTEAVLNALVLSSHAAQTGQLDDTTRVALNYMWTEQQTSGDLAGAWEWLQFDQEPWEAKDSPYYGATLAALAVGTAPEGYRSSEEIQGRLQLLQEYLNREAPTQSTINRIFLLWASTKWPGLISPEQQKTIIDDAYSKQQSDGGWRLASIAWSWSGWTPKSAINMWVREDGTPLKGKSDGVATGLIDFVLLKAGVPRDQPQLERGLSWLMTNQSPEGFWPASSVNRRKSMSAETGKFMTDAATAYAVLALTEAAQQPANQSIRSQLGTSKQ